MLAVKQHLAYFFSIRLQNYLSNFKLQLSVRGDANRAQKSKFRFLFFKAQITAGKKIPNS